MWRIASKKSPTAEVLPRRLDRDIKGEHKYNNWCKASKLIAPALTTIWSQIFNMGSWEKKMHNCLLLVINVLLIS